MLDALDPVALITRPVYPVHLAVSVPLVILVASFINVARLPGKYSQTILLIVLVITLVSVAIDCIKSLFPFSFPMFVPISEFTDVNATILPLVLSRPLRLAKLICPREDVTRGKDVGALTMLQTVAPFALIPVSILPLMNTVPISLALFPFTDV